MLDECKGERLEEVLAVFSNAVLKKVLYKSGSEEHAALAQQLAIENFSYHGERPVLASLIVAHKASLSKHLRGKDEVRARYHDFNDLLDLNERRIARRHEQLKQEIEENGSRDQISEREAAAVQDQVRKNWSGNPEWLQSILFGDSRVNGEGLLVSRFDNVWKHVESGSIGDVESKTRTSLLEQLDARVKSQESRLARWQDFGRTLSISITSSLPKKPEAVSSEGSKIDLGFKFHQALQIGRNSPEEPVQSTSGSLEEYTRLIENMNSELAQVGRPQARTQPIPRRPERRISMPASIISSPKSETTTQQDEGWSSASDSGELSPGSTSIVTKSTVPTPPTSSRTLRRGRQRLSDRSSMTPVQRFKPREESSSISPPRQSIQKREPSPPIAAVQPSSLQRPVVQHREPPPPPPPKARVRTPESMGPPPLPLVSKDSESDLADAILNSMSTASPSPKKQRHTLSLAERTRLSMSRASHTQLSDLHDDFEIADLPRLAIRSRPSMAPMTIHETEPGTHEGLIERTRKSMAGFEAAQKKAQLERRRSVKEEKKKTRQSNYFPKVEEEKEVNTPDISAIELMEGDPDYESVFKSRPKIKTSPAVSPRRSWAEDDS